MRWLLILAAGFVLAVFMAFFARSHQKTDMLLSNGDVIRIAPASFLKAMWSETSCKISCQPRLGEPETIIFFQDSDSQPAMIIPAAEGTSFFCLYYADVNYRLVRIDPSKRPASFPKGSYLSYIVLSSSCHIEPGAIDDWQEVSKYVKSVSDDTFAQQSVGFRRKALTLGVDWQIWNIEHGITN